jgi:hypothetical protein
MTKMMRIESILESMDLEDNSNHYSIRDPPIIKSMKVDQKKYAIFNKEKIFTKIIKNEDDNNYFKQQVELRNKIRPPPNFLY